MSSHRPPSWRSVLALAALGLGAPLGCRGLVDTPAAAGDVPAPDAPPVAVVEAPRVAPASNGAGATGATPASPASSPRVAWRFQAAAPSSGAAAVAPDGSTYVATVEGYVHALAADGTFRWSHNLTGLPLGTPAVDRAGQVYVATSAQRLYALRADGRVAWMHRPLSKVVTDVVWGPPGMLYFGGRDRRLYALAAWGGPLWSRQLLRPLAAAPAILPGGWVGVGTNEPGLWLFRGAVMGARAALPGALTQPILAGGEHWLAVAHGEVVALPIGDEQRVAWRAEARHAAVSSSGEWLVVEARRELAWLAPKTGLRSRAVALPDEPSAPPSVNDRGVALVPLVSGELFVAEPLHGSTARVKVAAAPLRAPVWSERTGSAVAVGSGVVVAVDLRDWPAPATSGDPVGMVPGAPPEGSAGASPGKSGGGA
jgi:hypothetical protein